MRSGAGCGQADADHPFTRDALDAPADVDLQSIVVTFKKQTLKTLLGIVFVAVDDLNGESPEGSELTIGGQLFPDSGTADLQDIPFNQQCRRVKCIAEDAAETCAVIKIYIGAALVLNVNFQCDWAHVSEQLDSAQLKSLGRCHIRDQRLKLGKEWMRQGGRESGAVPTRISVVTCPPKEMPAGHNCNFKRSCGGHPSHRCFRFVQLQPWTEMR